MFVLGPISDTHAGDVGKPEFLHALCELAPGSRWRAGALPERVTVQAGAALVHVLHDLNERT